jgi:hypothetical protein
VIRARLLLGTSRPVPMHPSSWTASMIHMDQALPVIPTFGTYFGYARRWGRETRFIPNIWMNQIEGMIHLRPAGLLVRLIGISGRTRG